MTAHLSRHEDNTRDDQRLFGRRFRQTCSCGWEAPGWWTNKSSASAVWAEHVREATKEEQG